MNKYMRKCALKYFTEVLQDVRMDLGVGRRGLGLDRAQMGGKHQTTGMQYLVGRTESRKRQR